MTTLAGRRLLSLGLHPVLPPGYLPRVSERADPMVEGAFMPSQFVPPDGPGPLDQLATERLRPKSEAALPSPTVPLEAAARSFQRLLATQVLPDLGAVESWCQAFAGPAAHAQLFRDLHRHDPAVAARLAHGVTNMPPVGTEFLGFHLLAELGRGTFARVYLAQQDNLANRHVVLKVAVNVWGEAQTLAQLSHPNIVPVYSIHTSDPFQAVCMPFQGATTLHDVLSDVQSQPTLPGSGKALLKVMSRQSCRHGVGNLSAAIADLPGDDSSVQSASGRFLPGSFAQTVAGLSYVESILGIADRLADGLAHAHERGIVHRDLKPANVLLADDGQPMLLDFNAAEDTKLPASATLAYVAGTVLYMAPEQLLALERQTTHVDPRCDIYAFGVVLFELLTGLYPFACRLPNLPGMLGRVLEERSKHRPLLRYLNRDVSPALEAIVGRCLAPKPEHRYQAARELQEDLERQRTHRPLRHIAEPSRRERVSKWARRHPRLWSAALVSGGAALLLSVLAALLVMRSQQVANLAAAEQERTRQEDLREKATATFQGFQHDLKTAQFLLYTRTNEPEQLEDGLQKGRQLLARYDVLDNETWREAPIVSVLPDEQQSWLAGAVGELLLLTARALLIQAQDVADQSQRGKLLATALAMNERAAVCSPQQAMSPALWRQRAALRARSGDKTGAAECDSKADKLPLHTAQDLYWLASDHVAAGRLREALPLLQNATRLDPQNYWAWFVLANCYDRLALDVRAEGCYGSCIALEPRFVWAHFNRGLAYLRLQDHQLACADFDQVIRLRPDLSDAYVNRALARQGLRQFRDAEEDLTLALAKGSSATRLYFLRSRVREMRGDSGGAQLDFNEGLRRTPTDEMSWLARGFAHLARNPQAALADFDQALRVNARSLAALQNKAHVLAEKLDRNQDALAVLNRAVDVYPDSASLLGGRSVVQARLGRRQDALSDAEKALLHDASPPRLYQAACAYALTSMTHENDRARALQLLSAALRKGYGFQYLDNDADLHPIRKHPEFRRLVDAVRALQPTKDAASAQRP